MNKIRLRQGTNSAESNHEAASTTGHEQKRCRRNSPTIDRPDASPPTSHQPRVQGSKRERCPRGWRHLGAPGRPTTIPGKHETTLQLYHYAIDQPTSTIYTQAPVPLGECKLDPVGRCEHASAHASPVVKPVRIPFGCLFLCFSDFCNFINFAYKFMRIPNLYYL